MNEALKSGLERVQRSALGVGVLALILSAVGAYLNPTQFVRSYLVAFWYWLALTMGCLALLMIQYMVTGRWGLIIRRPLEAATRTLPLLALAFLPILLNLSQLYKWARPELLASMEIPHFKRVYLQTPFWITRAVLYFAVAIVWAMVMNRGSREEDETGSDRPLRRMRTWSGPGLLLLGFIISYAAIDWIMSLDLSFASTIYGLIFIVVSALLGMGFAIVVLMLVSKYEPVASLVEPKRFNDFGNLLMVFTMLWAYLQFDQFLIIWAGNLQEEIPWYVVRAHGTWGAVAIVLFLFHFALPFMLLLQRSVTRRVQWLATVAAILLVMEWVDLYWIISPSFSPQGPQISWMDFTLFLGVGGVWIAWFIWQLKGRTLVPMRDPRFEGVVPVGS